jgi:translin
MNLSELADVLRGEFDAASEAREQGLALCRSAIRSCGNAIRAMHRYEGGNALQLISDAQTQLDRAKDVLRPHPALLHAGFVHDAEKELAEARITYALVNGEPLPTPEEARISAPAYAKGMAEAIGELRRHILDLLRHGELKRCEDLLGAMDDMYYVLVSMDYPDGITFGLRRLTDVARGIIERTRGDFTSSSIQRQLRDALEEHTDRLDPS